MTRMIFVNLPVRDLPKSIEFFTSLGFSIDSRFTDDTAACVVVSETIHAMLLTHAKFKQFTPKKICDAHTHSEVLICLSCETPEELRELMRKALAAGGTRYAEPKDYGFMIQDGFEDLDGHVWELVHMDPDAVPPREDES